MALTRGILIIVCLLLGGCEALRAGVVAMGENSQRQQEEEQLRPAPKPHYFYRSGNSVCDSATGYCQRVQ